MKKIILASSSPRRKELLKMIGLKFEVFHSDIDESILEQETAEAGVLRLSKMKAEAALKYFPDGIIIGADTLVTANSRTGSSEILGKPANQEDAYRMLKMLSGQKSTVYTGICLIDAESKTTDSNYSKTIVYMKNLKENTISDYIKTGEPMDKAGSYAIQGIGSVLIKKVEGDFYNGVGLSVSLLADMLKKFGIEIP